MNFVLKAMDVLRMFTIVRKLIEKEQMKVKMGVNLKCLSSIRETTASFVVLICESFEGYFVVRLNCVAYL